MPRSSKASTVPPFDHCPRHCTDFSCSPRPTSTYYRSCFVPLRMALHPPYTGLSDLPPTSAPNSPNHKALFLIFLLLSIRPPLPVTSPKPLHLDLTFTVRNVNPCLGANVPPDPRFTQRKTLPPSNHSPSLPFSELFCQLLCKPPRSQRLFM